MIKLLGYRFFSTCINPQLNPIVKVRQGALRGSVEKTCDDIAYYSFKGIPFADPPTGKLRFLAPRPPKSWQGIYDATKHGRKCPQLNLLSRVIEKGDDDCLFLNVYTKSLQPSSKLPVMVFIYFGAFKWGSSESIFYGPDFLLQHDVVVVTFNFRAEVLGFLCLDTPEVPGNAGMKDQVAALRWVQDNIEQFGGNKDNVTLFGSSSGAACVTYHMLSPMSQGLFHKAIAQSGVCISDWALGYESKSRAFRAGKVLGKHTSDTQELLEYLQSLPAEKLVDKITHKTLTDEEAKRDFPIQFTPVVEKEFKNVESFIRDKPIDLIKSGKIQKIPLIIGHNSQEGLISISSMLKHIDYVNANPSCAVRRELIFNITHSTLLEFGGRIKKFYCQNGEWSKDSYQTLSDLAGDMHFAYNIHRFTCMISKFMKNIYMYKLHYDTPLNLVKVMFGWPNIKGTAHGEDVFYLFANEALRSFYGDPELRSKVYKMTKMWTDFAKFGVPTPDNSTIGLNWKSYTSCNKEYLDIDDVITMKTFSDLPERDRILFWDQLYYEAGLPSMFTNYEETPHRISPQ